MAGGLLLLHKDAGILPIFHLRKWRLTLGQGLVLSHTDGQGQSQDPTRQSVTWLLGGTGLLPGGFCLPLPEARLKEAPPLPSCLPALWLPGKGRSSPGADDTVAKATRPYWPTDPGVWGMHGRGLVGRAGSMDSLFVEEVAASLVREFLSRKVRGAALHTSGQLL